MYSEISSVPVVGISLAVDSEQAQSALEASLARLSETDSPLVYQQSERNLFEYDLLGVGELHLQKVLTQLQSLCPFAIKPSACYPLYCETVAYKDGDAKLAQSANRLNQCWGYAEPLVEQPFYKWDEISSLAEKERVHYLHTRHHWDVKETRNIVAWGPTRNPTNCLLDATKAGLPADIKNLCRSTFEEICLSGVLTQEPLRGVKIVITDAILASNEKQRGGSQIIPMLRNLIWGLQLLSGSRLIEAIYRLELNIQSDQAAAVRALLKHRRGLDINPDQNRNLQFEIPVAESFGLSEALNVITNNTYQGKLAFSHWQIISDSPFEASSTSYKYICDTRRRKGFAEKLPHILSFLSKV